MIIMNLNAVIPISFSQNGRCALIVVMQKLFESLQPLIMRPNQTEGIRLTNEFNSFIGDLGLSAQEIDDTVNHTWNKFDYDADGRVLPINVLLHEIHTNSEKSFVVSTIKQWLQLINNYASNDTVFVQTAQSIADRDIIDSIITL